MIFSWKFWQNQLFLENIPPPKCCYSASFGILSACLYRLEDILIRFLTAAKFGSSNTSNKEQLKSRDWKNSSDRESLWQANINKGGKDGFYTRLLSSWPLGKILIISWKYRQNQLFSENIPPQMLLFRIFWYILDQYWYIFLAKNGISKFSIFPPL